MVGIRNACHGGCFQTKSIREQDAPAEREPAEGVMVETVVANEIRAMTPPIKVIGMPPQRLPLFKLELPELDLPPFVYQL